MATKKMQASQPPNSCLPDALDHFHRLKELLKLEGDAEVERLKNTLRHSSPAAAEKTGLSLTGLKIQETAGGLAGRTLITLKKRSGTLLPWTKISMGSPVILRQVPEGQSASWRAICVSVLPLSIQIALESDPDIEEEDALFRLDASPDEVTRQRQVTALDTIARASLQSRDPREKRLAELRQVLLGLKDPTFRDLSLAMAMTTRLNSGQNDAMRGALSAVDVAVIHGPPGTGKTTTVAELIRQAVGQGEKILVSAASNLAVDNVLERLLTFNLKAIRIGHPARVLPELRAHTLDYMVEEHEDFRLAAKYRKEAQKLFHQVGRFTRAKPDPGAKSSMRQEAKALMREAQRLEKQAMRRSLEGAQVLCVTATALDAGILGDLYFDRVVIDEAGQATEPTSWLPILWGSSVVLAGDQQQLPPTITSPQASEGGLGVSLMERLVVKWAERITWTLTEQYRMHAHIMNFPSEEFYDGLLTAHTSVAAHTLAGLESSTIPEHANKPLYFLDTAGADYAEEQEAEGESRLNRKEAQLVVDLVKEYIATGLAPTMMGIISPYAAQVRLLKQMLEPQFTGLEVESIDGFQGREKELIIISLVRSNQEGDIGFLSEWRRLNVAFTRARRKLIVVGDSATLGHHGFFSRWLDYVSAVGVHGSVWERMEL